MTSKIDPAGTTPGLVGQVQEQKQHNMKCKNANCDSNLAVEVNIGQPHSRVYRCVKCHRSWGVVVGGGVNL